MNNTSDTRRANNRPGQHSLQTVWLPPRNADCTPVIDGSTLPRWAAEKFAATYDPTGGPVAVLRLPAHEQIKRPRPALANRPAPGRRACLTSAVALAEPGHLAAMDSELVLLEFLRRLHTVLVPGAVLAVHTHTSHGENGFTDPGGRIVLAARKAKLAYLQHLVLVHGHPDVKPAAVKASNTELAPVNSGLRRIHTDLYLLTATEWTC